MEHQSAIQNTENRSSDADFTDALHELPFTDATISFEESDQESTVTVMSEHIPDSPSSPSSSGLRHRRGYKESQFFKNNPDGLIDIIPPVKNLRNTRSFNKLNERHLLDEPVSSSAITRVNNTDESVTVDSPNSAPDITSILVELIIKVISFQTKFLSSSVTFPVWLLHTAYLLITDPFGIIKLVKEYMLGGSSEFFGICYSGVKLVNHVLLQKHESTLRLCFKIGWGLLWFVYCGFILVSLLVPAFLFGGVMMRRIVEEPVKITEELTFDYTKDTPMAFVPILSCPESSVIVQNQKSMIESFDDSRVIPFDHEVQTTVSLTLPESDYNINLGIFQVRVDFLASDGGLVASARQPCMLQFKSRPIRLVSTFLNLGSLLTGYLSETQTLDIKFRGYTEKDVHTSCSRVVIEQRAEFERRGGVPEIYSASLMIESRLPFVKRILWYSKWLIYMWISVMTYIMELLFTLLCCRPFIFPWERSGSGSSYNNESPSTPSRSS